MMNKDQLVNPLSHMLEVPRNQLTNYHFIQGPPIGKGLDGAVNYLPVNTNGIIDASIRGNNCLSSIAGHHHHHQEQVINATVFTTASHHYAPLNMVTTNIAPLQHQHHAGSNALRVDGIPPGGALAIVSGGDNGIVTATVNVAAVNAASANNLAHAESQFKFIEAPSKHELEAQEQQQQQQQQQQQSVTMTVGNGDATERITVKIDPVDVAQLSASTSHHNQFRSHDSFGCVVKEELHHTEESVEGLLFNHMPGTEMQSMQKTSSSANEKPYKPFKCSDCAYETERKHRLKVHVMAIHTGEKPFKCTQCEYAAARKSTLKEHTLTIHSDHKPFECNECDYRTKKQSNLKVHMRAIHSNDKPFKCSQCDYASALRTMLKKHVDRFHSGDDKALDPSSSDCLSCSNVSSGGKSNKSGSKSTSNSSTSSASHTNTTTAAISLQQQIQQTMTISGGGSAASDGSDKPFHCTVCGFRTARRSNLKAHISTVHLKEKPYKCTECDFMTARRASLKTHMKSIHSAKSNTDCA